MYFYWTEKGTKQNYTKVDAFIKKQNRNVYQKFYETSHVRDLGRRLIKLLEKGAVDNLCLVRDRLPY